MAKVKIIRPALMATMTDGTEFRKAYGVEPYKDKPKVMVLALVLPLLITFVILTVTQIGAIPGSVRIAMRFTGMSVMVAEFLFIYVDYVRHARAIRDFYSSAIERGGDTVDAASAKTVKYVRERSVRMAFIVGGALLVALVFGSATALGLIGDADSFSSSMLPFHFCNILWSMRNANGLSAIIFLDLDEGAIIGQTLFPYTVLGDLRETEANRYELWYEGNAVMRGTLPKEAADALRETAAVAAKYASHLNAGAVRISFSPPKD
ncbi:MAG: hypothetical protein LBK23_07700 [Oscillospiraceae bacterium]|jgi:hypothetical protein|nr:hypothetical protein [Oscillospiraceae bacterium]